MRFVNLTPHVINILDGENEDPLVVLPDPRGKEVRCSVKRTELPHINGIPVFKVVLGDIEYLPEPESEVVYIVSLIVSQAARNQFPDREDLYSPGELVRGADGQPVGCKGLVKA